MTKIKLGCAGFDYKDWIGPFYPKNLKRPSFLRFYSKYFDLIEINSTFYNLPSENTIKNWYSEVPDNFKFIVKVWREITHKLGDDTNDLNLAQFLSRIKYLKEKLLGILFQFPPWFKNSIEHEKKIKILFNDILKSQNVKIILEFRNDLWFNSESFLKYLINLGIIIATTYMPRVKTYYAQNQNNYYIRLIGDRELSVFNRIQRVQENSINDLIKNITQLQEHPNSYEIFIIVNNHFMGFAPESANFLRKKLNLPTRDFSSQKKLSDYI